jgi:hypothetical protein
VKNLVLAAAAAFLLFVAWSMVSRALASDETKIRALIGTAAAEFNEGSVRGVIDCFARDYRDLTADVDRERLRGALQFLVLRSLQDRTRLEVEVQEDGMVVDVRAGEPAATAGFHTVFHERLGETKRRVWEVAVEADLTRTEDGWRFARSRHRTVAGGRPR